MKTCAVISEFNPFHNGHAGLLSYIRRELGEDTCILALLSGNYTERGEIAFADKFIRAEAAVAAGVNLVLEIPFPFSMSSAEFYARAGVSLADSLGSIDYLAFGSEAGDLPLLKRIAARMDSEEYRAALIGALVAGKKEGLGYARTHAAVYTGLYGNADAPALAEPNNILAIQYLLALSAARSSIRPLTVKRCGSYSEKDLDKAISAASVRAAFQAGELDAAYAAMPDPVVAVFEKYRAENRLPTNDKPLQAVWLAYLRTATFSESESVMLRLQSAARRCATWEETLRTAAAKQYTTAFLRRAALARYFGITSPKRDEAPAFTQILAADDVGRKKLADLRKTSAVPLVTKPADIRFLPPEGRRQARLSQLADEVFSLAIPHPTAGNYAVLSHPFQK